MQAIGKLAELSRYPVKSMAGERLEESALVPTGVYGDRTRALVDETKQGWDRYVTGRNIPQLLGYKARILDKDGARAIPQVKIEAPDGTLLDWGEELLERVQPLFKRKITLFTCDEHDDLLAVDAGQVLIVTDLALRKLEGLLGKPVDMRRFRANMTIVLEGSPFQQEQELIGERLRIGGAELTVTEPCDRCSMITLDPDSQVRDVSILKAVNEGLGLHFGIYATVVQPGTVRVGDDVFWMNKQID
ncbi:MOSC domain-containing protein [Paenibacillus protaetiae]|uniref:MOSC domain-containing protein n=1 Tax=Paenibacillus protaetiae TaxID=2509456 RepID=A0A4P6EUV6_9BACL|nr:MOSC domain-containing protein [Paenibacillus protaetiae]QAY65923.1 MOSC domain-containing protein [Paenibacillus protaetiae]